MCSVLARESQRDTKNRQWHCYKTQIGRSALLLYKKKTSDHKGKFIKYKS